MNAQLQTAPKPPNAGGTGEDPGASSRRLILYLGLYFSCHVLVRVLISDSLELDEAEQVVLSQWLLPGYSPQPPLYTWLQILFFETLGTNVFALSLLKNALLFFTYTFVFLSCRRLYAESDFAILATLSLLFIQEIAWQSQRDLTHSVLVLTVSAATLYVVLRLLEKRSSLDYVLFGLVLGLGMLTKYNYLIFAGALTLSLFTTETGRTSLTDRRILASLGVAVLIALPYALWFLSYQETATASLEKLQILRADNVLKGLHSTLLSTVLFLTPLWLVYLVFFPAGFLPSNRVSSQKTDLLPLRSYMMILFELLVILVVVFHVSHFKTRWMQPLLFVVPVYFFLHVKPEAVGKKARKRFVKLATIVAVLILNAMILRVVGAPLFDCYTDLNYPYDAIANEVRALGFYDGVVVAEQRICAGNLRLQFPNSIVLDHKLAIPELSFEISDRPLLVLWDAKRWHVLPKPLRPYLKKLLGIDTETLPVIFKEVPYRHARGCYARVGIIVHYSSKSGVEGKDHETVHGDQPVRKAAP